jgi:hypothetical protein
MPSKTLLLCALIGFGIVGALVGTGLFVSRDTHLVLEGQIQRVRASEVRAGASVVIADVKLTNPSGYPFMIKSADIEITAADGKILTGRFVPEVDAKPMFSVLPALGDKFNPTIAIRESIKPKSTVERMVATVFEHPIGVIESRKSLLIRFKDVDGPVSELR